MNLPRHGRHIAGLILIILASVAYRYLTSTSSMSAVKKGGVYFVSHGGPPTLFDTDSKPYQAWKTIGRNIIDDQPRGIVVVSAHWENEQGGKGVKVNSDSSNPLIYDFYGFPKHYYSQTFVSYGDDVLLGKIRGALKSGGIAFEEEKRGLDHGVWVPLKVGMNGKTDIPLVQVSLPGDGSPESTAFLGRALKKLREEGYALIVGGRPTPYAVPFQTAVRDALNSASPLTATQALFDHSLYKQAHPTPEHLLPLVFAVAGTDDSDTRETVYDGADGIGLGWGMWSWRA